VIIVTTIMGIAVVFVNVVVISLFV